MAVDLADLVENLQREVNPPGQVIFADATDADYEGYLTDSFWEMVLRGYINGFTATDTIVTPESGTDDIERSSQQLIIINAAMNINRIHLANIDTGFRAHAGSAEFETRKSAQAIEASLAALEHRFNAILAGLPSDNEGNPIFYTDVMYSRGLLGGSGGDSPYFSGY
jgi:hypothetical protein